MITKNSKLKKFLLKNAFPIFGFGALIWFLIRVIPKPSRAYYPCMRIAAPMASSFVLWILGLSATIISFKKAKIDFKNSSYLTSLIFILLTFVFTFITISNSNIQSYAKNNYFIENLTPNFVIGEAKGILPGRVVWVWNPDATNENCTNTYNGDGVGDDNDDGWFLDKNNNQNKIDSMLSKSIKELTNKKSDFESWDAIFRYFNLNKHNKDIGYTYGEKIFIKINATSSWGKGTNSGNITFDNEKVENYYYAVAETSPHLILSLLRQLVKVYGINQDDISVGDPMRHLYNHSYEKWFAEFPEVHYITNLGGQGREQSKPTEEEVIIYSDKGSELGYTSDKIYKVIEEADYLINVPTMKAHALSGVTLFPKNHFGSHTRTSARHLHPGLVAVENGIPTRTDSSIYRVQVDIMGHEKLGRNQVLFLLDALWSGSEAVDPPTKWDLHPFNGDWTSSIFVSQDMVAIESVAFDFLYAEYDGSSGKVNYPHMKGTSDYLRQAASSDYWPNGLEYDPEGDGTPIESLGVHEHWDNPIDKQYSRNLGKENGIELLFINNKNKILQAPSNLTSKIFNYNDIEIMWLDNSTNEDGFVIERRDTLLGSYFLPLDSVGANQITYVDTLIKHSPSYYYRVKAFNMEGFSAYSDSLLVNNILLVSLDDEIVKSQFNISQNYPNPFNPTTIIQYSIPKQSKVILNIYDMLGKEIKSLVNVKRNPGIYEVEFDGSDLTSGIYFYRIQAGEFVETKKMLFLK